MQFDVVENDGFARGVEHRLGFSQSGAQSLGLALFVNLLSAVVRNAGNMNEIAGQFDIDGPLESKRGMEDAIDFLEGRLRIVQRGGSHRELIEDAFLRVK